LLHRPQKEGRKFEAVKKMIDRRKDQQEAARGLLEVRKAPTVVAIENVEKLVIQVDPKLSGRGTAAKR
jgi:hypothetical protein